ncbi:hypothetical protein Tco_1432942, partial [Tanacetum coccineum]
MFVFFVNTLLQNTMAEQNVPAQPPTRTDEQIVPRSQWLIIGKSNLLFNAQKIQKNPIFQISFWNTMKYNEKTGVYSCQVDEQWFDLSADLLRKALAITLESVEAVIRAERKRVRNETNHARGPNVAPVARECTFAYFMKCSPITFRGNEGAIGLIRLIERTEMVFTVSKCTEGNKVVFAAATFQDRALTWWNSQVATLGMEAVTGKTWAEMKVMMMEEFCPPEEIQRMEYELWNLKIKDMDISSYTTRFNELALLCPGMVPTEQKKV